MVSRDGRQRGPGRGKSVDKVREKLGEPGKGSSRLQQGEQGLLLGLYPGSSPFAWKTL